MIRLYIVMNGFIAKCMERIRSAKRPKWFQWSLFPKEGAPPTQSILEVGIYALVLWLCIDFFLDINNIPSSYITIDADKLNGSRIISKDIGTDTTFFLHYQCADLGIQIPMIAAQSGDGVYQGHLWGDSIRIICLKDFASGKYLLRTDLNPYWHAVYDIAARNSDYKPLPPAKKFRDLKFKSEFYSIRDGYLRKLDDSKQLRECEISLEKALPDSLKSYLKNYYRFKVSCNVLRSTMVKDTLWHKKSDNESPFKYVFVDKSGHALLPSYNFNASRTFTENKDGDDFFSSELYHANNLSLRMIREYEKLCFERKIDPLDYLINNRQDKVGAFFTDTLRSSSKTKRSLSTDRPGWFDRHDISQGWYHISLKSSTIDSVRLTINFIGATSFYPMKIEPDEMGSNFISFSDPKKLLQIRKEGLSFYAQFKELENKQSIRCVAVTTFISGLLIVILTFIIIGAYRSFRIIRRLILRK